MDNLFLGRYPVNSLGMIDEGRMKNEASELFRKLGMTVNLDQPMRNMSVSQRQMCEIAKAISYNSKVIVLDEPTSSLTVQEVDKLFDMMRMLRDQGICQERDYPQHFSPDTGLTPDAPLQSHFQVHPSDRKNSLLFRQGI